MQPIRAIRRTISPFKPAIKPVSQSFAVVDIAKEFSNISQLRRELEALKQKLETLIEDKQAELNDNISNVQKVHEKTSQMLQDKTIAADQYLGNLSHEVKKVLTKKEQEVADVLEETAKKAEEKIQAIKIEHKGIDGKDGQDAPPVDEEKIVKKILAKIPKVKDGKDADHEVIVKTIIDKLDKGEVKIKSTHVDGFENSMSVLRNYVARGSVRGGGDTVKAGTGVSITTDIDGKKVINASGTAHTETPTGAINGLNVTYTTSANITTVIMFAINGQIIHPAEYSFTGNTITFITPLPSSLSGTGFTISYV